MPDEPTEEAMKNLRELPDTGAFALFAHNFDGDLQGTMKYGSGESNALAKAHFAMLGAHIRAVTEALDQQTAPNQVAQAALNTLDDMETNGRGVLRERDYDA